MNILQHIKAMCLFSFFRHFLLASTILDWVSVFAKGSPKGQERGWVVLGHPLLQQPASQPASQPFGPQRRALQHSATGKAKNTPSPQTDDDDIPRVSTILSRKNKQGIVSK